MRPGLLALLAPLLAAQPALAQDFRCPDRGGPAWREVQSAHVLLLTDLSSGKAQELAREIERMYDTVRHGLFRKPPEPPGRLRVVAFRSEEDFRFFAPKHAAAYYLPSGFWGPTIVMPGVFTEAQRMVVAHELTHARRRSTGSSAVTCSAGSSATPTCSSRRRSRWWSAP
jgi:hypothetical protein